MRRRLFLGGMAAFIAAPAIVARENIMGIKVARPDDTITGLQMLWQAERDWSERFARALENVTKFGENITKDYGDHWTIIHPDEARLMRIGVDHARPGGDTSAIVRLYRGEVGTLDCELAQWTIMDPGQIVASNYGRGPGLLTEDEKGVRQWRPPQSTAQEIRAKIARAERQLRAALEPKGSARWR